MSHISFFLQADACFQKPAKVRRYLADGVMSHDELLDRDSELKKRDGRDPAVIREEARLQDPAHPNDPLRNKANDDLRGRGDLSKDPRTNDVRTAPSREYVINEYYRFDKGVRRLDTSGNVVDNVNTDRVDDAIRVQHPKEYAAFKAYVVKNEEKLFSEARKNPGLGYYFDYSGKDLKVALSEKELKTARNARSRHVDPASRVEHPSMTPLPEPGGEALRRSFSDINLKKEDKTY